MLIGLPTAFVAALIAVLRGDETTRSFVGWAFPALLAFEVGILTGAVEAAAFVIQEIAAFGGVLA